MLNKVSPEIGDSLSFITSASQMWKELQDRFSSIGFTNYRGIYIFLNTKLSLVELYVHKMKGSWDEFNALEPTCCGKYLWCTSSD